MTLITRGLSVILVFLLLPSGAQAQEDIALVQIVPDVIYGHKSGMALTFDVFKPANANGAAVLRMVSGGWRSRWQPPETAVDRFRALLLKGVTVVSVRHGSSPKFNIPEALADVRRAVRYVRLHAGRFGIDPDRMGVWGSSAGGHLSLLLGTTSDTGDQDAEDEVDRTSNRVAAVVAYYPPVEVSQWQRPDRVGGPFDFDPELAESVAPILHVSSDDPPTLLIHGDQDETVPIGHSQRMYATLQETGVKSKFITIPGAGHGFRDQDAERAMSELVAWFEEHLVAAN